VTHAVDRGVRNDFEVVEMQPGGDGNVNESAGRVRELPGQWPRSSISDSLSLGKGDALSVPHGGVTLPGMALHHSIMKENTKMKKLIATAISLVLVGAASVRAESTVISPNGSRPSAKGAAEYFTGSVVVDPLYPANADTTSVGGLVTFEPGARSAWHTHPAGQVLIVTSGTGWVQEEGGEKQVIRPGDVVWTPPGVKHWHGATATNGVSHIAITNLRDGRNVDWMEKVSDEEYLN
jgi:quercetin dioxygenase-like cupin family protein